MDTSFVTREQDRLLRELIDFLSIPSVSALPAHASDCRRAAEWLRDELLRLGCPTVEVIEGNGHPVVWAEGPQVPGRPTLLVLDNVQWCDQETLAFLPFFLAVSTPNVVPSGDLAKDQQLFKNIGPA